MIEKKKSDQLDIKSVTHLLDEELSQEAKNVLAKLSNPQKIIEYKQFYFKRDLSFLLMTINL